MNFSRLFATLGLDGALSREELNTAAVRLGWHWREAPVFAVLDLLSIQEPIPKKTCAYLGEMTEDPSGRPGRTFRTDSFRIWTVPGFAPGGLVTYLAMVQETGTTPPVRALL